VCLNCNQFLRCVPRFREAAEVSNEGKASLWENRLAAAV
jgi:hypothetical protein